MSWFFAKAPPLRFEEKKENELGRGAFGVVYRGMFEGNAVAVKVFKDHSDVDRKKKQKRKWEEHLRLDHENVLKLLHVDESRDKTYLVLELCAGTLTQYIAKDYNGPELPPDGIVLYQIASGLHYVHSQNLVHRDVQPDHILISMTTPVQMKLSNFTFVKKTSPQGTFTQSGVKGTEKWMAPEILWLAVDDDYITELPHGTIQSDTFAAGCVYFYFLTRGKHPFGKSIQIPGNILKNYPIELNQHKKNIKQGDDRALYELIGKMIKPKEERILLAEVIEQLTAKLELKEEHFARSFVPQMIANDPEKRISLQEVIDHLKPLQPANRLSLLQYDNQNLLCSAGTISLVYHVETLEESPLAVKIVPRENCTEKSLEELKQLDHSNIVRFLHFDENDFYKYFGMELCVASLDQIFLPEGDQKKYTGPIPSDEQFCFQLISGLQYIHGKHLVHGSIKPTNILISSSKDPQIKLSDFGLTTSCLNEGQTTKPVISGFLGSQYWLAPELLLNESGERQFTKESDIFAAGSVFFYFLSKGCHLFGDTIRDILTNPGEGNQVNLFKKMTVGHFAMGLIRWMTQQDPKKRPELSEKSELYAHLKLIQPMKTENLTTVETIQFSRNHLLDSGGQGSVYLGRCESSNTEAVVKRIQSLKEVVVDRELKALQNLNHPNIVKFFDSASDADFIHIAIEKCLTSLEKYCRQPLLYHGVIPMPTDQQVLLQMAEGLHYIHSQIVNDSQPLIHRDVKPENILISCDNPAVIKWADFGLSRAVVIGSKSFTWSHLKGTERWLAPELIQRDVKAKVRGSQSCDVFALGCVFFFFLTQGLHPFGDEDKSTVQNNIKNRKQVNLNQLSMEHFAFSIVEKMIRNDPHSRPKMSAVVDALKLPEAVPAQTLV